MTSVVDCEQCYHRTICKNREKFENFVESDNVPEFMDVSYGCAYFSQRERKPREILAFAESSCHRCVHGDVCGRSEGFNKAKDLIKDLLFKNSDLVNDNDLFEGVGVAVDCADYTGYEVRK